MGGPVHAKQCRFIGALKENKGAPRRAPVHPPRKQPVLAHTWRKPPKISGLGFANTGWRPGQLRASIITLESSTFFFSGGVTP